MPFKSQLARLSALSLLGAAPLMASACTETPHLEVNAAGPTAARGLASNDPFDHGTDEPVRDALARGEPVDVLVLLDPSALTDGITEVSGDGGLGSTQGNAVVADAATPAPGEDPAAPDIRAAQDAVLDAVSGIEPLFAYEHFPMLHLTVRDQTALEELTAHEAVVHVFADKKVFPSLTQSLPLIHQPEAAARGQVGTGTAVAVLDTGTDYSHPAFGSCSAPGGACKVAYAQDFAPDDNSRDADGHGTNVAGIVLGVAPGTKILALDVFNGASASSSVILQAVDWVIANRAAYNIASMNLSLGSGLFTASCPNDVFASGMAAARSAGVMPAIATGNNGSSTQISSPACVPAAVSVAAVYDAYIGLPTFPGAHCSETSTQADQVTCFSNSAPFMSVFAPGSSISAAGLAMSGTSQATPHVAGAAAVLHAARPNESVEAIISRITGSGPMITDARNGVSKRRLDVDAALGSVAPADGQGPTGSVSINGGAEGTNSVDVTLTLSASDASGVASMCLSATSTCKEFTAFSASKVWSLAKGDGVKTVYAYFKDTVGNLSGVVTDTILLDTAKPKDGKVTTSPGNGTVVATMTGSNDGKNPVSGYKVVYATIKVAPKTCNEGTTAYQGPSALPTLPSLTNGTTYYFRMCTVDSAGNMSAGITFSARPAPEFDGPSGSVVIAHDDAYTKTASVDLAISASDASAVREMCVSNTSSCTLWQTYATSLTFKLNKTAGLATVYVKFRDQWGNVSAQAATDTIQVDTKAPTMGGFTAATGAGLVQLSWATASDGTGSGVGSYLLVYAAGTRAPANCNATPLYSGTDNAFQHSGLSAGKHSYRLCARDALGNTATGKVYTATVP